jgi:hypothetical protein
MNRKSIKSNTLLIAALSCILTATLRAEKPAVNTISAEGRAFFEKEVRPLLVKRCFECHGGSAADGGLSLGSANGWRKGGDSGPALVPGKADESLLIEAINYDSFEMPPAEAGGKLPADEIAILTKWIAMGAPDPRVGDEVLGGMTLEEAKTWWAFQPLQSSPPAEFAADIRYIDELLQLEIERHGLVAAPAADRRTLLRRLTYGLTGLPPSRAEVDAFVADPSPKPFSQEIERLLDSPQYGVQWGRRWLDVVRYADTAGENSDYPLPHAWRYRNWVIDAVQRDMPFDQFVRMQLAGDLLTLDLSPEEHAEGIVATGYLAIARRFGHDSDKDMFLTYEDVIDNLGKSFLGLTISCARCHDHKYDPVSAEDYYALYGIFESTKFSFPGCEAKGRPRDLVPLMASLVQVGENTKPSAEPGPMPVPVAYAVVDREAKNARLHERGEPDKLGPEVPRRWLSVFGGAQVPDGVGSGRRELGAWISEHPLAARVMVNRIWEWHFGHGLVRSSNDFGTRGEPPTHPELLDFLASRFVQSGYSVKAMHRLILNTAAYQQASATPVAGDPENRWLAYFSRRRLTAEELRDSLLTASGGLDLSPGTSHPFPAESTWRFTQHHPFNAVYETNKRSAFMMVQRQRRHPFLALFDGADPNASTPSRQSTTVPTQALYFINDPFFHAQAAALAAIALETPEEEARLLQIYRRLFQRDPTQTEQDRGQKFLQSYPGDAMKKWSALSRVLLASNEFLYVD